MRMYKLEERIMFDGAAAADVAEQLNNENSLTGNNSVDAPADATANTDNSTAQDASSQTDIQDTACAEPLSPSNFSLEEIQSAISSIVNTDTSSNLLIDNDQQITVSEATSAKLLILSDDIKNADSFISPTDSDTIVIEYDPEISLNGLLETVSNELNGREVSSIYVVAEGTDSDSVSLTDSMTISGDRVISGTNADYFLDGLNEFKTDTGTIDLVTVDTKDGSVDTYHLADNSDGSWDITKTNSDNVSSSSELHPEDTVIINQQSEISNHGVAFIDTNVKDYEQIADTYKAQGIETVTLNTNESGVRQISDYLSTHSDVGSIHIVSEGNYRQIMLGNDVITADNIGQYKEAFCSWQTHLSSGADVLFYGCDIGKDNVGQEVLEKISVWTGADIAASTDVTGLNGNWNLEYSLGHIKTASISVSNYNHNLETYTVSNITDDGGGTIGSLSWAINMSNISPDIDDTIAFNLTSGDTVTISGALPKITDGVTIDGTNNATGNDVTVQVTTPGVSTFRVFNLNPGAGSTVTIQDMTIKGGDISSFGEDPAGYGGGIYVESGILNLENATVSDSKAFVGGGIYNAGTLTIMSSTISSNIVISGGGGGGISNAGTLTIESSTINSNTAADSGGGIFNAGTLTIASSTISSNAAAAGGGICNAGGILTITSSTISSNTATGMGGGLFNVSDTYLLNTIIINNTAATSGGDIYTYTEKTTYAYYSWYNQIGGEGTISTQATAPNITSPYTLGDLGPLQDNGGPTKTMAVSGTAPARGNGTYVYNNATDGYYLRGNDDTYYKIVGYESFIPIDPEGDKITTDQRGVTRLSPVTIGAYQEAVYYYRTVDGFTSGNWDGSGVWERSLDETTWTATDVAPTYVNAETINIRSGNVTVTANITIDQAYILSGAIVSINNGITLTVTDGTGTDLTVTGNLTNNGGTGAIANSGNSSVLYNGGDQTVVAGTYYGLSFTGSTSGSAKTFTNGTTSLGQQVSISENITLNGSSSTAVTVQVTSPGVSTYRVFNLDPGAGNTVTIQNITIKGGDISSYYDPAGYGGGIYVVSGALNLSNSVVSGSKALAGGGIYNAGTLTIASSTINSNTAGLGGGLLNGDGAAAAITSSTISNNIAISDGGGIWNGNGNLTIASSTISGNTAVNAGGIYSSGTLIITSSTISSNTASEYGGGLLNDGNAYLLNTIIINNTAATSGGDIYTNTGKTTYAYYSWYNQTGGDGTISTQATAPNITSPYTLGDLGPLQDNGGPTKTMAVYNLSAKNSGSYVYNNATDGYYLRGNDDTYYKIVGYESFIPIDPEGDKITTDQRGVTRSSPVTIGAYQQTSYYYRTVDGFASGNWDGSGVWERSLDETTWTATDVAPTYINAETINIRTGNVTVTANTTIDQAYILSGAIVSINNGITLTVIDGPGTDLTVTGNLTNNGGTGAIANSGNSSVLYNGGDQTVVAGTYYGLSFAGSTSGSAKTFTNGTTSLGQQVSISENITLNGSSSTAVTVQVASPGVSTYRVFNLDPGAGNTVTIQNITIKGGDISSYGNDPAGYGGGIYAVSGTLNLSNSVVSGSKAFIGGGIFNAGTLTIASSTISSNTTTDSGGGIYNNGGTLTVVSSTISSNTAANAGGGIYNGGTLTVVSSTINSNTAANAGGGILNNTGAVATITSSTINSNIATSSGGGGILNYTGATATITSSTINSNTAADFGGGIYNGGTLIVSSSTISSNGAVYGSGIYNDTGAATIVSSTISSNTASEYGGGLLNAGDAYLLNTIIINNTAVTSGGDIYTYTGKTTYAYYSWYNQTGGEGTISTQATAPNITSSYTLGNLEPLQDNGGLTKTMAVSDTAPAIDNGSYVYYNATDGYYLNGNNNTYYKLVGYTSFSPANPNGDKNTTDQRGVTRSSPVTIGAYQKAADNVYAGGFNTDTPITIIQKSIVTGKLRERNLGDAAIHYALDPIPNGEHEISLNKSARINSFSLSSNNIADGEYKVDITPKSQQGSFNSGERNVRNEILIMIDSFKDKIDQIYKLDAFKTDIENLVEKVLAI